MFAIIEVKKGEKRVVVSPFLTFFYTAKYECFRDIYCTWRLPGTALPHCHPLVPLEDPHEQLLVPGAVVAGSRVIAGHHVLGGGVRVGVQWGGLLLAAGSGQQAKAGAC